MDKHIFKILKSFIFFAIFFRCVPITAQIKESNNLKPIEISVEFDDFDFLKSIGLLSDTVMCYYYKNGVSNDLIVSYASEQIQAVSKDKRFHIVIFEPDSLGYYTLFIRGAKSYQRYDQPIQWMIPVQSGDKLLISYKMDKEKKGRFEPTAYGVGASKVKLNFVYEHLVKLPVGEETTMNIIDSNWHYNAKFFFKRIQDKKVEMFKDYSTGLLTSDVYSLFETDLKYEYANNKYFLFRQLFFKTKSQDSIRKLLQVYNAEISDSFNEDQALLTKSKNAGTAILMKIVTDICLSRHQSLYTHPEIVNEVFNKIIGNLKNELRNKVLLLYFEKFKGMIPDFDVKIRESESLLNGSIFSSGFDAPGNLVRGKAAYQFTLINTNQKLVRLSDFKGKLVFVDFWYTGCTWCADYYQKVLKSVEEQYHGAKIVFITVCIDKDLETWKASVKSGKYTGDGAINLYTNGFGVNHPLIQYYAIHAYPYPILIDQSGAILNSSKVMRRKNGLINIIEKYIEK